MYCLRTVQQPACEGRWCSDEQVIVSFANHAFVSIGSEHVSAEETVYERVAIVRLC